MKKISVIVLILILILPISVSALDIEAPTAPDSAEKNMPENTESFAEGVWHIIKTAVKDLLPEIYETAQLCLSVFAVMLLISVVESFSNASSPYSFTKAIPTEVLRSRRGLTSECVALKEETSSLE